VGGRAASESTGRDKIDIKYKLVHEYSSPPPDISGLLDDKHKHKRERRRIVVIREGAL
jgi:hypothetical protein